MSPAAYYGRLLLYLGLAGLGAFSGFVGPELFPDPVWRVRVQAVVAVLIAVLTSWRAFIDKSATAEDTAPPVPVKVEQPPTEPIPTRETPVAGASTGRTESVEGQETAEEGRETP